jgi:hypothetical protein
VRLTAASQMRSLKSRRANNRTLLIQISAKEKDAALSVLVRIGDQLIDVIRKL